MIPRLRCFTPQALCTLLRSYNRLGGDDKPFEYYCSSDIEDLRLGITEANEAINEFHTHKGENTVLDIANLSKRDVKNLPIEQRQMILFKYYRDRDNSFRNTFGQNNQDLRKEIEKILKNQSKLKSLQKSKTVKKTTLQSKTVKSKNNDKIKKTTPTDFSSKQRKQPPLCITAYTTSNEIDSAGIDDSRSEYFRLASHGDRTLTIDKVLQMNIDDIKSKLHKLCREMQITQQQPMPEFHLTCLTSDVIINNLNVNQCKSAIISFGRKQNVNIEQKYLDTLTIEQLILEVKQARDAMKQEKTETVQKTNDSEKPTKDDTNENGTQHGKKTNTMQSKTNENTRETNTSNKMGMQIMNKQMPAEKNKGNTTTSTSKKQLAENLNGANVSAFDTYKPRKPTDLRAPPKPMEDTINDQGHQAAAADRTIHTIHASIQTNTTQINPPPEVRRLITQMRKGDPMIQIIPTNLDNASPSETIGNENELPDDETKLSKWVDNIRTIETKIHFTMKIKAINIENVQTAVFSWCKGRGTYIKFTQLKSSRIFTGG